MTALLWGVVVALAILALLVARGMWLLGRESDAEQQARAMSDSHVSRIGWNLLDRLQTADLPLVSSLEERLGINHDDEDRGQQEVFPLSIAVVIATAVGVYVGAELVAQVPPSVRDTTFCGGCGFAVGVGRLFPVVSLICIALIVVYGHHWMCGGFGGEKRP